MKKQFTTGQFAKLANVSERTIRYYDTLGLLKPSFIMQNGYRMYCEEDFVKLQKILSLKHLGFSLQEIHSIVINDNIDTVKESLDLQIQLLDKKIQHLSLLKEAMLKTKHTLQSNKLDWKEIIKLTQLCSHDENIVENYRNSTNLSIRIQLHERFSTNEKRWFPWLFDQINFQNVNRLLELGCGDGALWKNMDTNLRTREVFLSDVSEGMLTSAKQALGDEFSYMRIDAQNIPFKKNYFDSMIANHTLFYLNDVEKGLQEIWRVMKRGGTFYCSTYGKHHMEELSLLVREFDNNITLSDKNLYDIFGLDNGKQILNKYFSSVTYRKYEDSLEIDEVTPIYEYIMSCHGNQKEILHGRIDEFKIFLNTKLKKSGVIHVKKDAGLFICKKNKN